MATYSPPLLVESWWAAIGPSDATEVESSPFSVRHKAAFDRAARAFRDDGSAADADAEGEIGGAVDDSTESARPRPLHPILPPRGVRGGNIWRFERFYADGRRSPGEPYRGRRADGEQPSMFHVPPGRD